ncbi:Phytochrome-like protein cph1 [Bremerella volcania]|uniref:histidine kinase n=1 Tax=Bremerella volcania TaxID=2527984 RepID=A0A518C4B4_9BACT|nr:PAS domain S-box protein [Bremerella volcania]QDU74073.1 Phytochrome-like protein cph1 [Bremerella volcania]
MNLLRKYFLLGAIPALIAVGLSTILDYQITQRLLREQIDQTLEAKLDAKRNEVRFFLDKHFSLLETLAATPLVKDGTVSEIIAFLRIQELAARQRIEGLYYDELDGTVHGTDGVTFNVFDREYFGEVLKGNKVTTRILQSRGSGQDILLLVAPVHTEDGTLKGAIGLTILDSQLIAFVRSMEVNRGGFLALIDDSDRMIAASSKAEFVRKENIYATNTTLTDDTGTRFLVSATRVPDTSWDLIVAIPEIEVQGVYNRMAWSKVTAVACGITAAVILALFFSERTIRPLQQIIQTFRQYARGDQSARFSSKARGEFAILAESFNNMADELDAARVQQEEHVRRIESSEDRFRRLFDGAADAIFLRDLNGIIIDANQEACRSLGYERDELKGLSVSRIDTDWNLEDGHRLWNQLARDGGRYHPLIERIHRRKDGSTFPVEIRLTLIEREGETVVMSAARDATLRKAAEKQTKQAKEFAEKVINASPGVIYIFDLATQSIVFINQNIEKELGHTKEYLEDLGARFYTEIVHPDDVSRVRLASTRWYESGEPEIHVDTFRLRHANGQWAWFEFHRVIFQRDANGHPTQILGVATNTTDRVLAQQQLVWEKALLDQVMETSIAAIMVVDTVGNIQFLNPALEKTLRVGREYVQGQNISAFPWEIYDMAGKPLAAENRPFALVKSTLKPVNDIRYRIQFGPDDYVMVSANGAPLFDENGEFAGAVFALADITERIESEKVRESLIRSLEATNTELKQFTYTVSHDLKSPLITIKGFLGILTEDIESQDKSAIEEDLSIIGSAADGMKQLLDDLLELSRIGRNVKSRTMISLNEVISEAITLLAGQIESQNAEVRSDIDDVHLYGDAVQIRQLMQNLIDNGIKHNRKPHPKVTITAHEEDDFVLIEVIDNGPGVAIEYQERIFQLFDKLDPDSEGTGIGLAIVKRIVDFHGGTIELQSDGEGNGCTFRLKLPAVMPTHEGPYDLPDRSESTLS